MLRITYDDNGTSHNDLTVQVGNSINVGDSYYLTLSRTDSGKSGELSIPEKLTVLFDRWLRRIEEGHKEFYLLLDISDESTTWLKCSQEDNDLFAIPGWSTLEGHSVDVIREGFRTAPPPDFQEFESPNEIIGSVDELKDDLLRSQAQLAALKQPVHDPTPLFEHFRGTYSTQLLTVAVAHLNVFDNFNGIRPTRGFLQSQLQLQDRPFNVLLTGLKAMELLTEDSSGQIDMTPTAREHFQHQDSTGIADYIGLAAETSEVLGLLERLKTNRPAGMATDEDGVAFIYRDGIRSAMEESELARYFTMSLAGRARNVAPVLADRFQLDDAKLLLDIGGGSGIYSICYLARNHNLRAIVLDRPEVLPVAVECARHYGVEDRLEVRSADMFKDPLPTADVILLSNVLHDWDVPECTQLVNRCAQSLPVDGRLLIHDVFLNDDLSGPLPIALYSTALFSMTEGRAYSVQEYTQWLSAADLTVTGPTPTLIHCGVLCGQKTLN
ncbi:methyltransferase [Thalassoglobus sp. JC818]|uniref:methyltransferase n=1 Tax=Thalassoglobus sp. JC818 TaxID=3232136 RepID=UPI003458FD7D